MLSTSWTSPDGPTPHRRRSAPAPASPIPALREKCADLLANPRIRPPKVLVTCHRTSLYWTAAPGSPAAATTAQDQVITGGGALDEGLPRPLRSDGDFGREAANRLPARAVGRKRDAPGADSRLRRISSRADSVAAALLRADRASARRPPRDGPPGADRPDGGPMPALSRLAPRRSRDAARRRVPARRGDRRLVAAAAARTGRPGASRPPAPSRRLTKRGAAARTAATRGQADLAQLARARPAGSRALRARSRPRVRRRRCDVRGRPRRGRLSRRS